MSRIKTLFLGSSYGPYLVLFFTGFLLYFKTLFFDLTYLDDNVWILDYHWYLRNSANLPQFFSQPDLISDVFYRPLLSVSFMINAVLGGTKPFVYHLTNLGIHLINACLVFIFLGRMGYARMAAFVFSLIFTVHPVLTQAVVWIPGRTDSLLATFVLAAFIYFLNFVDRDQLGDFVGHMLFFGLALLTKETAVVLPVLCFLYLFVAERKKDLFPVTHRWLLSGWIGIGAGWWTIRYAILASGRRVGLDEAAQSILENTPAFVSYLGKVFLPFNLAVLPVMEDTTLVFGVVASILLIVLLIVSRQKRWPRVLFGAAWFILFLLPSLVISFLNHEYRLYLPILGVMIILLEVFRTPDAPVKGRPARGSDPIVHFLWIVPVLGGIAFGHSGHFQNRLTFWESAVKTSPHSPLAHRNLGAMYYLEGYLDKAAPEFQKALELNPFEAMAHNNLGLIYMNQKKYVEAEREYLEEIRINPSYDNVHFNYGLLCFQLGRPDEAVALWKKTIALNPKYLAAYYNLVVFYFQSNDLPSAGYYIQQLEKMGVTVPPQMHNALKAGMRP